MAQNDQEDTLMDVPIFGMHIRVAMREFGAGLLLVAAVLVTAALLSLAS